MLSTHGRTSTNVTEAKYENGKLSHLAIKSQGGKLIVIKLKWAMIRDSVGEDNVFFRRVKVKQINGMMNQEVKIKYLTDTE